MKVTLLLSIFTPLLNFIIYPFFYIFFIFLFCFKYIIQEKNKLSLNSLYLALPLCLIILISIFSNTYSLDFLKFLLTTIFLIFSLIYLLSLKDPLVIKKLNYYLFYFSCMSLFLISMQIIFSFGLNLFSMNLEEIYNSRYDFSEYYENFYFGAGRKNTIAFYLLVLFMFSYNFSIKNNYKLYAFFLLLVFLIAQLILGSGITFFSIILFFILFFIKKYSNSLYKFFVYFFIFFLIFFHFLIFFQSNYLLSIVDLYLDTQGGLMYRVNVLWTYVIETYNFFGNGIFYMQDMNFNTSSAHNIFFQALGDFGFSSLICLVFFCIYFRKYSIDYLYLPILYSVSFHMGFYEPFFISALLLVIISFKNEAI